MEQKPPPLFLGARIQISEPEGGGYLLEFQWYYMVTPATSFYLLGSKIKKIDWGERYVQRGCKDGTKF